MPKLSPLAGANWQKQFSSDVQLASVPSHDDDDHHHHLHAHHHHHHHRHHQNLTKSWHQLTKAVFLRCSTCLPALYHQHYHHCHLLHHITSRSPPSVILQKILCAQNEIFCSLWTVADKYKSRKLEAGFCHQSHRRHFRILLSHPTKSLPLGNNKNVWILRICNFLDNVMISSSSGWLAAPGPLLVPASPQLCPPLGPNCPLGNEGSRSEGGFSV